MIRLDGLEALLAHANAALAADPDARIEVLTDFGSGDWYMLMPHPDGAYLLNRFGNVVALDALTYPVVPLDRRGAPLLTGPERDDRDRQVAADTARRDAAYAASRSSAPASAPSRSGSSTDGESLNLVMAATMIAVSAAVTASGGS